jgi:predicted enzyme related to lactoylglutathione lyase
MIWTTPDRFDALRDFYVGRLGLRPRSDRERFVNFEWEGMRLTIGVHDRISGPAGDPLRVMVNFATDDLAAFHEELVGRGVACLRPPGREEWGWMATYSDPDGNTVQVLQPDR